MGLVCEANGLTLGPRITKALAPEGVDEPPRDRRELVTHALGAWCGERPVEGLVVFAIDRRVVRLVGPAPLDEGMSVATSWLARDHHDRWSRWAATTRATLYTAAGVPVFVAIVDINGRPPVDVELTLDGRVNIGVPGPWR